MAICPLHFRSKVCVSQDVRQVWGNTRCKDRNRFIYQLDAPCALHSRKSVVCVSQGVITGMSNGTNTRYNDQNWFVKMALSALHLIKSTVSVSQEVSLSMSKGTQARLFKALIYRPIHWLSLSQKKSSYIPPCRRRSPSVWIASTKMASSALRRSSSPENRKHGPAGSNPVKKNTRWRVSQNTNQYMCLERV